jgi:hypothetical protein
MYTSHAYRELEKYSDILQRHEILACSSEKGGDYCCSQQDLDLQTPTTLNLNKILKLVQAVHHSLILACFTKNFGDVSSEIE